MIPVGFIRGPHLVPGFLKYANSLSGYSPIHKPSIYLLHLLCITFGNKGLCFVSENSSNDTMAASDEVRIPHTWKVCRPLPSDLHDYGHPCVKLTVTSAFTARDFHHIDCTHAGDKIEAKQIHFASISFDTIKLASHSITFFFISAAHLFNYLVGSAF